MFKKAVKLFLNPFLLLLFRNKLLCYLKNSVAGEKFLVLDIDNTLANTWEYIKTRKNLNKKISYIDIPLLTDTRNHIKANYPNLPIIFISHRNIFTFHVTNKWIKKNITQENNLLILVSKPSDKLSYLNFILKNNNIVYYDDLSYNHENGKVLYYKKIIQKVKKMNLIYYDYSFIKKLNTKKNDQ